MNLFLDTNVVIDYLAKRESFAEDIYEPRLIAAPLFFSSSLTSIAKPSAGPRMLALGLSKNVAAFGCLGSTSLQVLYS